MAKKLAEVLGRFYKSNAIGSQPFDEYCEKIWPLLSSDEKKLIYRFLFNSKQWKTYLFLVEREILQTRDIDWPTLTQILHELKLIKSEDQVQSYMQLAKSEGKLNEFIKNYSLDKYWKKIRNYRKDLIEQKNNQRQKLKSELMQEYQFAKTQRLLNKQKDLLEQLNRNFPDDYDIQREVSEINLERAKRVIEKKELSSRSTRDFALKHFNIISDEEKDIVADIKKQFNSISNQKPKDLENYILFMLMIEENKSVLELVTKNYEKLSPWFALDVLLQSNQFLEVINFCEQLREKTQDPETIFTLKYNKALALWNLKKKDAAIEIMKELVSVRPDFRSSSNLLIEWSGEKE